MFTKILTVIAAIALSASLSHAASPPTYVRSLQGGGPITPAAPLSATPVTAAGLAERVTLKVSVASAVVNNYYGFLKENSLYVVPTGKNAYCYRVVAYGSAVHYDMFGHGTAAVGASGATGDAPTGAVYYGHSTSAADGIPMNTTGGYVPVVMDHFMVFAGDKYPFVRTSIPSTNSLAIVLDCYVL